MFIIFYLVVRGHITSVVTESLFAVKAPHSSLWQEATALVLSQTDRQTDGSDHNTSSIILFLAEVIMEPKSCTNYDSAVHECWIVNVNMFIIWLKAMVCGFV